jgi:hypothetical protein
MDAEPRTIYTRSSLVSSLSSGLTVDPLSDVLTLLKPQSYLTAGLDAGGGPSGSTTDLARSNAAR